MKEIQLTQGYIAQVDDEDFEYLSQFKWHACKNGKNIYAERSYFKDGKSYHIFMHREIIKAGKGIEIDHAKGNGLNNQKSNLRECTHSQNLMNSSKYKNATSKFKGVYFDKKAKKWIARLSIDGKNKYLGCSLSEIEAAKMYDMKAKEIYGDYARLNYTT